MHFTLDDYVLDIFQNAVEAGAGKVEVELDESPREVRVLVRDNGSGMSPETLERARDPFFSDGKKHPGRRMGLGLPFLEQAVHQTGGHFSIKSKLGVGTEVEWLMPAGHWDTPPLGSVSSLLLSLLNYPGDHELVIRRRLATEKGSLKYTLLRSELREVLGSLEDVQALGLLKGYLISQEDLGNEGVDDGKNDLG